MIDQLRKLHVADSGSQKVNILTVFCQVGVCSELQENFRHQTGWQGELKI
jgi:hypothetical protein